MDRPEAAELAEFQALEDAFNEAMVSNDVKRIADHITDDWILVTPEKGPVSRAAILGVIGNGVLTHDWMVKTIARVKRYGDVALVTGRGQNTGTFRGAPIQADEWITDVYRLVDGRWRCVLTHLTPAPASPSGAAPRSEDA
ncbi:nuclear transport factor 2 family protein [Massilia arenosa]|uniref:Nuclear transport factor 2 family protein n=1 Tax=Zemynaea arenosa TaxID=2561931 RepID=A0A4Y9SGQ0_9BURK|nr:nuclear transport factor 2 family protein [Massilia arenosa]TFW23150.1 nuclear transport factor 2 family protein [Massilia arenosa]